MKLFFSSKKVSLLWKALFVLFLFQTIVLVGYAYLSKQELNKRFQQEKFRLKMTSEIYFEKAVNNHAFEIQDSIYALTYSEVTSIESLSNYFREKWDYLSVGWGLNGIAIYNVDLKKSYQQGQVDLSVIKAKLDKVNASKEPLSYLVCRERCELNIIIPIRFNDKAVFLFVSTNLFNAIYKFQDILQLKTAIISTGTALLNEQKQFIPPFINRKEWLDDPLKMLRKEANPLYYELLNITSKNNSLSAVLSKGNRISYKNKYYFVTGFRVPFEEVSTSYLIIVNDISEIHKLDHIFNRSYVWFSLLTLFVMFFVILIVLWRPIARIKKLQDYLPLLASADQIDVFPRAKKSDFFIDEIDSLENTSIDLANRLNQLNNVVNKRETELKEIAMFDNLTGLANRTYFIESLKESISTIKSDEFITLFFIDLDRFKQINDTLGHHIGDEVLKIVAKRLSNTIRSGDLVARLGGDEFTVLLKNISIKNNILNVVNLILDSFEQPANVFDMKVNIQLSIGITVINKPTDSITNVIKQADIAMYNAKNHKDKRYSFFEPKMENAIINQFNLINDFSTALKKGEFTLNFQPLHMLQDNSLTGFECLIRWQHEDQGLLMPDVFLPILKKTKYMRELEYWILEEGIKSCKKLNVLSSTPIKCAINFSADMFMSDNITQKIRDILNEEQLDPSLINIEIVEDSLVQDIDAAISRCNEIRNLGVKISIDDFGVGYSSLNYLRRIPADNIKIDRSFISEIEQTESDENNNDLKVLSSLIDLLLSLNKTIVAEGVETKEQSNWLAKQGCTVGQGYFFNKPLQFNKASSLVLLQSNNNNIIDLADFTYQ